MSSNLHARGTYLPSLYTLGVRGIATSYIRTSSYGDGNLCWMCQLYLGTYVHTLGVLHNSNHGWKWIHKSQMACGWGVCIISPSVFFVANFACSQSADYQCKVMIIPKEDLTKSGYKPEMKYKLSLTILLCFWLHDENRNLAIRVSFFNFVTYLKWQSSIR